MRKIVLLVEGSKDAYFLHELIMKRFGMVFLADDRVMTKESVPSKPFILWSQDKQKEIEIFWTDGKGHIGNLRQKLMRPMEFEDEDEFVSGIIFDADCKENQKSKSDHNGEEARRLELLKAVNLGDNLKESSYDWLFLFPNNKADGDLESVLRYVVKDTDNHTRFFDDAWKPFVENVVSIPDANRPTNKSMMNEYKAAFNDAAWDTNGLNRCYADDSLWDWSADKLDPLVNFLSGLINGACASNLGGLLK